MENGSHWRRLRQIFRRNPPAEVDDELEFHLEERIRDFIASGMDPEAARRAALERLGDLGPVRRQCARLLAAERRAEERRRLISVSWVDVKLGLRMLVKYPGLSIVAVLGMAVAIAIGAGAFGFLSSLTSPTLPLDEGERMVAIQNWDAASNDDEPGSTYNFVTWRSELNSVQELAAFTTVRKNLLIPGGGVQLVEVAQMTASGFRVARTPPLLGRTLLDDDERDGAPPVVVIAYEEWQRPFGGDADIVGRPVRFGNQVATVVGVMPEGFRFPINHGYWMPLRLPAADERTASPPLSIFGRLVEGATLGDAQAELAYLGERAAAAYPETHQHLRPRVLPYAYSFFGLESAEVRWSIRLFQLVTSLLLVAVAVNVAVLVYARTATRLGEIAVRTALGASRRRVVTQLFAEALVLSGTAAVIGLTVAGLGLGLLHDVWLRRSSELPYWFTLGLSPGLIAYVLGLALLGGLIVGVLPALKATGRRLQTGLQQLSSHGSQMQLGRTWTALIITQVAVAVAVLPFAIDLAVDAGGDTVVDAGYPADEFLRASLSMEREERFPDSGATAYEHVAESRFRNRAAELLRRLEMEPAVEGVTFARYFPGGGTYETVEVESPTTPSVPPDTRGGLRTDVLSNRVDTDLFGVFGIPVLAGRGFVEADVGEGSTAVIVDQLFADQVLGGGDVLGRRVRRLRSTDDPAASEVEAGPWLEIVGVVPALTISVDRPRPVLYQPVRLAQSAPPVTLAIRVRASPASTFVGRLREVTAAVDPTLQLYRPEGAADSLRRAQRNSIYMFFGIGTVSLSVLLLSAAGISAMMSFTVAKRRREIGIRAALGAAPRQLLGSIFARAAAQIGSGVVAGLGLAVVLDQVAGKEQISGRGMLLLPLVAVLMMATGLLAAMGPARRSLAVQPTEALREE